MRKPLIVLGAAALLTLAVAGCGTPVVPSVGLLPPYQGQIVAGHEYGSWFGINPIDAIFPENSETIVACSVTGGPVSATLDSYVDPAGADTDIRVSVFKTQGLGGELVADPDFSGSYEFPGVGVTATSASLAPGECFRLVMLAPMLCLQSDPDVPLFAPCIERAWPGITYTIDW